MTHETMVEVRLLVRYRVMPSRDGCRRRVEIDEVELIDRLDAPELLKLLEDEIEETGGLE